MERCFGENYFVDGSEHLPCSNPDGVDDEIRALAEIRADFLHTSATKGSYVGIAD